MKSPLDRGGEMIHYILLYMDKQYTSIRITKELREILGKIGRKNETYEDIIKKSGCDVKKL